MYDWEVNNQELQQVLELMGITWPVMITRTSSKEHGGQATWRGKSDEPTPLLYINVEKRTTAEEANRILWHELAHCMQYQRETEGLTDKRLVITALKARQNYQFMHDYSIRPSEIEAKTYEQAAPYWNLTRSIQDAIADL